MSCQMNRSLTRLSKGLVSFESRAEAPKEAGPYAAVAVARAG